MLGFISKLFGIFSNENKQNIKEVDKLKSQNLNFNPQLIEMLKSDHKKLFELYIKLQSDFKKNSNYKDVLKNINEFKLALEIHLMIEDSQLYGYIVKINQNDETMKGFLKDVQNEMKSIAEEVILFIRKYSDYRMYHENKDNFLKDLSKIGKVLTKRVEMEESRLYTLYQN